MKLTPVCHGYQTAHIVSNLAVVAWLIKLHVLTPTGTVLVLPFLKSNQLHSVALSQMLVSAELGSACEAEHNA